MPPFHCPSSSGQRPWTGAGVGEGLSIEAGRAGSGFHKRDRSEVSGGQPGGGGGEGFQRGGRVPGEGGRVPASPTSPCQGWEDGRSPGNVEGAGSWETEPGWVRVPNRKVGRALSPNAPAPPPDQDLAAFPPGQAAAASRGDGRPRRAAQAAG